MTPDGGRRGGARCLALAAASALVLVLGTEPARAAVGPTECGTYSGTACAPVGTRVDLAEPRFSQPTRVTNPLFPIGRLRSAVLLGEADGESFRAETTLLPGTVTVRWRGQRIAALASQYLAWEGGRIKEAAVDLYAQADDGAVWYLGEDVIDYERGTASSTGGSWLAGREGPPGMIMPGRPRVGDVYRPENMPGVVFEEVTVTAVDRTVQGPSGPVAGAIVIDELHLEGEHERKTFAPGYGEFVAGTAGDSEAVAVAAPTDALPGGPPPELDDLAAGATAMVDAALGRDWRAAGEIARRSAAAWDALRGKRVPPLLAEQLAAAVAEQRRATAARSSRRAAQAALDLRQSALDLGLRYRPAATIDRERFELWCHRIRADAARRDRAGVSGAVATLEWIRDRIAHTFRASDRAELDARLGALRGAADGGRVAPAADHAARLVGWVRRAPGP